MLQIQIEHAPEKVQKFNIPYVSCSYKYFLCDIRCRIPAIRNRTIEIEYLDDEDVWVVLFSDACVGEVFRCTKPIFGSKKGVSGPKLLRIQVYHKTVHRRQKTTN